LKTNPTLTLPFVRGRELAPPFEKREAGEGFKMVNFSEILNPP
jgi:hypothetical protein